MRSKKSFRVEAIPSQQVAFAWDIPGLIAGVDEAGRGPLAGPVVAAAVILDDLHPIKGLNDSKVLSAARREKLFDEIRAKAVAAFISLGCSGLARVDFFLTPSNEIIINELNTMPGFTATSVFPKMWEATGVSYAQVITHLLQAALTRNNAVLGN